MKSIFIFLLLLLFSFITYSQTSYRMKIDSTVFHGSNWNSSHLNSISACADGGICIAGYSIDPALIEGVKLVKVDSVGNVEWCKVYGSWNELIYVSLLPSIDSGFFLTIGEFYNGGYDSYRFDILRLDVNGNVINKKSADWCTGFGGGGSITRLSKEAGSDNLNLLWWRPIRDQGTGNLISYSRHFTRMDSLFSILFSKRLDFNPTCTKEIYANGTISGFLVGGLETQIAYNEALVRLDEFGNVIWKKIYPDISPNLITDIVQVDSFFFMIETSQSKIALRKIDFTGNTIFYKVFDLASLFPSTNWSVLARLSLTNSSSLLISFIADVPFIIETDLNGFVIRSIKGAVEPYKTVTNSSYSQDVLLTLADTIVSPYRMIFEKELISNPSCNYSPILVSTNSDTSSELTYYPVYNSSNCDFITNYIDTVSYYNLISNLICYSVPTSDDVNSNSDELQIYPNPASMTFKVQLPGKYKNTILIIYNALGEKVYSVAGNDFFNIECDKFPKGIYIVNVVTGSKLISRKIIIE